MNQLQLEIRELVRKRRAVFLAHNYQRDEIQEIADHTGDSLGLSQIAASSDAEVIVFCGVHFMAESAAILAPKRTVLLPRKDAGCPMADMISPEGVEKMRLRYPGGTVVAYVNTSAAVKAHSDICCTSANAVKVVLSLPESEGPVIMIPDQNLARYVASQVDRKVVWWDGFCPVHHRYRAEDVLKVKRLYPKAVFVAHPECRPEVLELADHITSTSGMYLFARETGANEVIIGTENGVLYRMRSENPGKTFIPLSDEMICPNMKLTTLEDVRDALMNMAPVVTVPEDIRNRAVRALDRMLAVPRD
ncbi:MAG TPA: quinolinate synthase NadA [Proteobacteria bacterium]|nr:quinolinate synthase A [bacterium BMS3Abin14]HDL52909.1 quinolinate synthase NadA [Pseudomonadota bacterium]